MTDGEELYSSGQACKLAGISDGSLRNYCQRGRFGAHYARFFSAGAAPPPGQPRQFTGQDVALLRYIKSRTANGAPHATVAAELAAGALASFEWQPPEESAAQAREARSAATAGPGEAAQGQAVLALASQWRGLLEAAQEREAALTDRLIEAETRAARFEGELTALKAAQSRGFFRRLFGG